MFFLGLFKTAKFWLLLAIALAATATVGLLYWRLQTTTHERDNALTKIGTLHAQVAQLENDKQVLSSSIRQAQAEAGRARRAEQAARQRVQRADTRFNRDTERLVKLRDGRHALIVERRLNERIACFNANWPDTTKCFIE